MQVVSPFCTLCGVLCADPLQCRLADTVEVQRVVRARCTPTALHYKSVMALSPADRRPLCMACVNWKRRARKKLQTTYCQRRSAPCFTPMDSVLLHAISPGHFPEPDQRCFQRLARAAADPANGYSAVVPACVRRLLEGALAAGEQETQRVRLLRRWWEENAESSFFRFPETARAVRHCLVSPDPAQEGGRRRWRR
jgi:hypothetical protein